MKGPYHRVKFDLRRIWECPLCKRRERTAGSVTSRFCQCQMTRLDGLPVVMKLVEDGVQRPGRPTPVTPQEPLQVTLEQAPLKLDERTESQY